MLRIIIQLLAWGDSKVARRILPDHKARLYGEIQDRLDFEQAEIRLRYRDEIEERKDLLWRLSPEESADMKTAERHKLEKRLTRVADLIAKMEFQLAEAAERARMEREAVDAVEVELLAMFADPEQRKRYFAIVDLDEIAENDFNLNIPRYVDTFEPDEEIDLQDAVSGLNEALKIERKLEASLLTMIGDMKR